MFNSTTEQLLLSFPGEEQFASWLRTFRLIWICRLTLSSSLVAVAWIYFQNNRVVQQSQEWLDQLVILCLIISTIVLKFVWNSVISCKKSENVVYAWSRNRRSHNHMYNWQTRTPIKSHRSWVEANLHI